MTVDAPQLPDPAHVPDVGGERPLPSRAGRNLPAAIGVGLALGAVILGTLFTVRWVFAYVVVGGAIALGTAEVARALRHDGAHVPLVPLLVGGMAMIIGGYERGDEALVFGLAATALATLAWRAIDGPPGVLRDWSASMFTAVWVPFLAGFAAMMTSPPDGARRVVAFIATAVCSDVGGYAAGVLAGKHPMAPSVSPKKSWEGFGGSVVFCAIGGAILLVTLFDAPWWQGLLFGLATAGAATIGDLAESLVKRDLGIKDMGHLLPGHGGMMDRLDSLLVTAPVSWLLLTVFVPT